MNVTPRNTVLVGDALQVLSRLRAESVDVIVTSPPWFGQRDYGVASQIGREDTVDEWAERLALVLAELKRVLAPHGSAWLDLGDTYSRSPKSGAPSKSLLLAPERLALIAIRTGWILRNKVIWHKVNPMPDGVKDRLTNTYDVVFHLTRSSRYFYDLDAIRAPVGGDGWLGKNPGDFVDLPVASFKGNHFATFPGQLVERPILSTCPLRVCVDCGRPWTRQGGMTHVVGKRVPPGQDPLVRRYRGSWRTLHQPGQLAPNCKCDAPTRPGLVLDPFFGTGTVGAVADRLKRDWLGIEVSPRYAEMARERLGRGSPELASAA